MPPPKSLSRQSGIVPVDKSTAPIPSTPLLDRLKNLGFVTAEQLRDAGEQAEPRSVIEVLVDSGALCPSEVATVASFEFGRPWINPSLVPHDERLCSLLPRWVAVALCVLPIHVGRRKGGGNVLYVVTDDPTNEESLKACELWSGLPAQFMVATSSAVRAAIAERYGAENAIPADLEELDLEDLVEVA